jgi:hypothetical protein
MTAEWPAIDTMVRFPPMKAEALAQGTVSHVDLSTDFRGRPVDGKNQL